LVQRVRQASVTVDDSVVGAIDQGLCVMVGIGPTDTDTTIGWAVRKLLRLRIFSDADGKMNRSLLDIEGGLLLVSQFTLYGDAQRGNRPSFTAAAAPARAEALFRDLVTSFQASYESGPIATGQFAADMQVHLVNDGPVTIWLESPGAGQGVDSA
jgi:D-tyrosyl-tRNA(Tyr) deacylase